MDDHDAGAPGGPSKDDEAGAERGRGPLRDYTWEGRPGEDFGPIAPPAGGPPSPPRPAPRERRRVEVDGGPITDRMPVIPDDRAPQPERLEPPARPASAVPARRRRWRPILTALGVLVLVGGLVTAVLLLISRQASEADTVAEATPVVQTSQPSPAAASPAPTSTVVSAASPVASPVPAGTPTPLALGPATAVPSPTIARSPFPFATPRVTPVIVPALPGLVTPPGGLRFPTATPARLGTPFPTRTPPPLSTVRPISFLSRVWSDQVLHRVGDNASICGAASTGANAQLTVIAPDRSTRTLGEFQPPSERVCYTMRLDEPGLYVLSLIVKDAGGTEIDRQSGALSAGP